MILKTAWRNIWRNKRRTIITIGSAFFAVFFAILMRSMQLGTYDKMIGDVVNSFTGYVQIHKKGYWEDKVIDNAFERDTLWEDKILASKYAEIIVPRLESYALAAFGKKTKGTMVVGIEPNAEDQMTHLKSKIVKGQFSLYGKQILVAEGLAKYLELNVGDSLVLIGQGYHGVSAQGLYKVSGILHFPSPKLNKSIVYLSLPQAQDMYGAYNMLTNLCISVENNQKVKPLVEDLKQWLDLNKYEIYTWKEMLTELVQAIQTDNVGGIIMLAILYMIIGFGIFGTIVMMTAERRREFGMLIALGMHRKQIIRITVVETLLLGLLGVILGAVLSIPIVYYFHTNPIVLTGAAAQSMINFGVEPVIPFALRADFFLHQAYTVLGILVICMLYPIAKIQSLNLIKAIRH